MLILSSTSLRGYGLNRIFELTKTAEYGALDLAVNFKKFDTFNASYINKLIQEWNLPVHAVSAPQQIPGKKIEKLVKLTKEIGAKVLVIQPPKLLERQASKWLKKEIPKLREEHQVSIALENAPAENLLGFLPGHSISSLSDLKKFKHVCLDTGRLGEKRQDLMRIYASIKNYLVHIHLSNVHHGNKYAPPQEGILPLESFLTKLKQDNYPGAISLKIMPKHLHAGKDEIVIAELKNIKGFYKKYYEAVDATEAPSMEDPNQEQSKSQS